MYMIIFIINIIIALLSIMISSLFLIHYLWMFISSTTHWWIWIIFRMTFSSFYLSMSFSINTIWLLWIRWRWLLSRWIWMNWIRMRMFVKWFWFTLSIIVMIFVFLFLMFSIISWSWCIRTTWWMRVIFMFLFSTYILTLYLNLLGFFAVIWTIFWCKYSMIGFRW